MNKKEKKIHLFIGWVILILIAILLFPDKNIALRAERPHLGQLSTRTIVAPFKFEVPKTEQEIQNEKARAADKINAIFEFNADETTRQLRELQQYLKKLEQYGKMQALISSSKDDGSASMQENQGSVQHLRPVKTAPFHYRHQAAQHKFYRPRFLDVRILPNDAEGRFEHAPRQDGNRGQPVLQQLQHQANQEHHLQQAKHFTHQG